ncbi:SGNH hydrolase [Streptomyces fructofermentans]|uniref:SGNH hydrolase n=1 Tax=Streptomyces fructofermentans TaxID=152141 RepID=A0A918K7W5_9ACTN|nr:SGNH hydrolase [Streptomyces fructofermentans]
MRPAGTRRRPRSWPVPSGRSLILLGGALTLTVTGTAATHPAPVRAAGSVVGTPASPVRAPAPAQAGPVRQPAAGPTAFRAPAARWTGTWEAAASGTAPGLPGASIRNVVRTSVGGTAVRVRLTNRLGTRPLAVGAATVARQAPKGRPGADARPGTMRVLTFGGRARFTVPPGRDVVSDPLRMRVPGAADLLVTVHTPGDPGPATYHRSALRTTFVATAGNRAADVRGTAYRVTSRSWYYVTGVDVLGPHPAGSVVALGDSLTDGSGSTPGAHRRWPDRLAARLRALPPGRRQGVLNAGVAGNRLLLEGRGPSARARFDADVLSRTGVRTLIVLEGINDIRSTPNQRDPAVIAAAYRELVRRAHTRGIRVLGATLTPFGGNAGHTRARERVRRSVNRLIRTGRLFDAVVDFDAVVRDPARPERLLPAYDSGDHLHLNDAGLRALADSIDPAALRG